MYVEEADSFLQRDDLFVGPPDGSVVCSELGNIEEFVDKLMKQQAICWSSSITAHLSV